MSAREKPETVTGRSPISEGARPILFYFDFLSPYGYLGGVAVERLAAKLGRPVVWRPVLLGVTVLRVMGLKALPDTPLKREYVAHDLVRLARLLDIPFKRCETPMKSLSAMRAFVWLDRQDQTVAKRFGQAIFRKQWGEATDMSSPEAVGNLAASLGIDSQAVLAAIDSPAVKEALRIQVDAAIADGVFGVPTFVVDGEMFWGTDRLPMVERWIETGGW